MTSGINNTGGANTSDATNATQEQDQREKFQADMKEKQTNNSAIRQSEKDAAGEKLN